MTRQELAEWLQAFRWADRDSWTQRIGELISRAAGQPQVADWLEQMVASERPEVRWALESAIGSLRGSKGPRVESAPSATAGARSSARQDFQLPRGFRWLGADEARAAERDAQARFARDTADGAVLVRESLKDFANRASGFDCLATGPSSVDRHGKTDPFLIWARSDEPDDLFLGLFPAIPQDLFMPLGRDPQRLNAALERYGRGLETTPIADSTSRSIHPTAQAELSAMLRQRVHVDADDLWPANAPAPSQHRVFFALANSIAEAENCFVVHPAVDSRPEKLASVTDGDRRDPVALFRTVRSQAQLRVEFHQVFGDEGPLVVVVEARYLPCSDCESIQAHNQARAQDLPLDLPVDIAAALMLGMSWSPERMLRMLDQDDPDPAGLVAGLACTVRDPLRLTAMLRPYARSPRIQVRGSLIVAADFCGLPELLNAVAADEHNPELLEHIERVRGNLAQS